MFRVLIIVAGLLGLVWGKYTDYCIIGAGPSGLQMGYFLERAGRDYLIYERDSSPGWFYKKYPRHRTLISINKRWTGKTNSEFNLRHDWNSLISDNKSLLMTKYSKDFFPHADVFVQYLKDYAETLKLKIQYNTYIQQVSKHENIFTLRDLTDNEFTCKYLIVSTGSWVESYPRNVKGIELTNGYPNMSVNANDYEGQSILIIGRGNSAFETAQHLQGATNVIHMMSRERLKFSWETHYVGDVRAVNDGPIDTYMLKSLDGQLEGDLNDMVFKRHRGQIHVMFKSESNGDEPTPENLATRQGYDSILRCTGFKFDRSIYDENVRPELFKKKKKFPHITPKYESVKTENMFFTGVITHSLDWPKSAGGFIHGFRYTTRALHKLLEWRNHGKAWPHVNLPIKDIMNHFVKRINEASGLYQMTAALCDVIAFRDNGTSDYFEELPVGTLQEFEKNTGKPFTRGIVVRLEYGKNFSGPGSDPFREDRATGEAQDAHNSNFLHPVLYYYNNGIGEVKGLSMPAPQRLHHMVEDFLTEWIVPVVHLLPLRWFFEYAAGEDLRQFYAETCFQYMMTEMNGPPICEQEYMKGISLPNSAISNH